MKSDLVDIAAVIRHETDKAYLVYDGRDENIKGEKKEIRTWLPKSQVEYNEKDKVFIMPEWLALEKGFI